MTRKTSKVRQEIAKHDLACRVADHVDSCNQGLVTQQAIVIEDLTKLPTYLLELIERRFVQLGSDVKVCGALAADEGRGFGPCQKKPHVDREHRDQRGRGFGARDGATAMKDHVTREQADLEVRDPVGHEKSVLGCSIYGCHGASEHVISVGSNKSREVIRLCDSHVNLLWKALSARIGRNLA